MSIFSELPFQLSVLPSKWFVLFRPNFLLGTSERRRADALRRPEIPRCLANVILPLQITSCGYMWLQELLDISVPALKLISFRLDRTLESTDFIKLVDHASPCVFHIVFQFRLVVSDMLDGNPDKFILRDPGDIKTVRIYVGEEYDNVKRGKTTAGV